ncbi:MAG: phage baseplate assembly protein V [Pseudomonadota bacterium]
MTRQTLPDVRIMLGGRALGAEHDIVSVRVLRALSSPAMAEISLRGQMPLPGLGTELRVEGLGPRFDGKIAAAELARRGDGARVLTLRAFDALQDLRLTGRPEALFDVTPADIARAMGARLGIDVHAPEGGPRIAHIVRTARSDFDFLLSETRRVGLWFYLAADGLHLTGLDGKGALRRVSLETDALDARLEANAALATGAITFSGIAPTTLDDLPGFAFGLEEADAFGANGLGTKNDLPLFNVQAGSADEALEIASAEMAQRDAARVTLRAVFEGADAPALAQPLEIAAPETDVPGPLVVTRVEHRLDASAGHIAEISTAPPPLFDGAQMPRSFWGIVVDNDDPLNAGRLRCKLPQFGDVETDWLQVTRAMAGPGRGFAYVPTTGDKVLIHSPSGRPEHGVVLGALTGRDALALDAGDGERFGFVTGAGHRLTFDEGRGEAELEVPSGSRCTLGPKGIALSAQGDLTLEAPGRRVLILGDRIDFERG